MSETTTTAQAFVYHYFFSFVVVRPDGNHYANGTLQRTTPITSIDDVNEISARTAANMRVATPSVVLLSYSLLRRTPLERQ